MKLHAELTFLLGIAAGSTLDTAEAAYSAAWPLISHAAIFTLAAACSLLGICGGLAAASDLTWLVLLPLEVAYRLMAGLYHLHLRCLGGMWRLMRGKGAREAAVVAAGAARLRLGRRGAQGAGGAAVAGGAAAANTATVREGGAAAAAGVGSEGEAGVAAGQAAGRGLEGGPPAAAAAAAAAAGNGSEVEGGVAALQGCKKGGRRKATPGPKGAETGAAAAESEKACTGVAPGTPSSSILRPKVLAAAALWGNKAGGEGAPGTDEVTAEHVIVGVLLFTPLLALLPTTFAWYLLLSALRWGVVGVQAALLGAAAAAARNPVCAVLRRALRPAAYPGEAGWRVGVVLGPRGVVGIGGLGLKEGCRVCCCQLLRLSA